MVHIGAWWKIQLGVTQRKVLSMVKELKIHLFLKLKSLITLFIAVTPFFEVSPVSTSVQLGSNLTLNCSADGFPALSIEWVHFDSVIRNSDASAIGEVATGTVVTSTLTLVNIDTSVFGQYYCRARTSINGSVAIESERASVSLSGMMSVSYTERLTSKTIVILVAQLIYRLFAL